MESILVEDREDWLYESIRFFFYEVVEDPLQLTEYLVKQNCLNVTDLHEVRKMLRLDGRFCSASELLSRLRRRPYWIQDLLEACSQPELGLDELRIYLNIKKDMHLVERTRVFEEEKPQSALQSYEFEGNDDWFYESIYPIFCDTVNPLQLTEYLVEQNCLDVTDLHEVRKMLRLDGRFCSASELLSRLRRRPYWVRNLLEACSQPELGLDELRIHMNIIKDMHLVERTRVFEEEKPQRQDREKKEETIETTREKKQLPLQFHRFEGKEDWFYDRIRYSFCRTVDPLQLSEYLVVENCLTVSDLLEFQSVLKRDGRYIAAAELLRRLRRQPAWLYYLLKACYHSHLELDNLKIHIIALMDIDYADLKRLFKEKNPQLPLHFHWLEGKEDWFYERIRYTFCRTVDPLQLSEHLVKQNCLTVFDLQEIQKIFRQDGRIVSAAELLSRLRRQPYWVRNLLKASSQPELGLDELRMYMDTEWPFKLEKSWLYPFRPESTDEYIERHTKKIQMGSSGKYYEKLTDLLHTTGKTDEQIAFNWEQPLLRWLRPPVSFTHKMISPDLKYLFQSVESAFCVPEDTEQLSFAANLLKAVHIEEIASKIKLLSDRLDFINCRMVYGDEDPGTICALDVDIVLNKDHLEVIKRDLIKWNYTSVLKSEKILKVILVHSRSLRVVETKLRVYKEYEKMFRSKTLHLQHEYEDFDDIAKKSAFAKVSSFQTTILYLVESISFKKLAEIVSEAAEHFFLQQNVRDICYNEFITDEENVGTVNSNSYICRLLSTVRRIKRTLVTNTLRTACKSLGFKICKGIMGFIKFQMETYFFTCDDQRQLNIEISDTLIETFSVEMTPFLISICDSILFATGSLIGTVVFSVDVNSENWRRKVADAIFLMISEHRKIIVEKAMLLVKNMCTKTAEDLKRLNKSLEKWKEKTKCMDIIELVSIWEKREAMKNISGLGSYKSVLNLIAGIKNDKPTLKVFLSIDDQDAIGFIKDHPEIPNETNVEFVVVKSYKEQKDQAETKSYSFEKNEREMLSKTIKKQGERMHANHSGVVGLGIGNMNCYGLIKPCIIIYCLDKDLVPFGEKPLPETLEGFRCDIREDFIMFGACFDCHEIAHPNPGCCIGRPSNGAGSAGFLVKTNESGSETSGFLTAAHVAAENWTDLYNKNAFLSELEVDQYNREIVHPLLPNNNSGRIIGQVKESFCGNWGPEGIGIDAAFVQNYEQDKAAYREIQPADESELDYGDQIIVLKRGGTTGKTYGRLIDGSYSPCVNPRLDDIAWRLGGFYFFDRCFAVEDISGPFFNLGDSGSGVFLTENEHPTKPLGIAFAKLEYGKITVVSRIDQVARAFNLRLYEIVEPMEA